MKIIFLRKASLFKAAAAAVVVVVLLAAAFFSPTLDVFSYNYDLPIYSVACEDKKAAITFDCAWGADDIPDILNTLNKEDVKATFFIVGQWAEKHSEAVKLIAQGGHDIANHSYSHLRMGVIGSEKIRSEILKCSSKLTEISGTKVELFRPPYGDYSKDVTRIAGEMGYYTIQWDVDSLDWKPGISQNEIINRVNRKVNPGSIILFHNDTAHTSKLLPDIITSLKNSGYELVPVSKMILRDNYSIDFEGKQRKNK
jgi:polysaccharide deacetylase family sporulation protein PdaB